MVSLLANKTESSGLSLENKYNNSTISVVDFGTANGPSSSKTTLISFSAKWTSAPTKDRILNDNQ